MEALPEPDDDALDAAVAHQKVGADADGRNRDARIEPREKIGKIFFVRRREENLRRAAGAKPAEIRHAHIRFKPAPQVRGCPL